MKDKEFKKLMDSWADYEVESAPELEPTAEMRGMVADLGQGKTAGRMIPRWVMTATALASLAVLIMLVWMLLPTDTQNGIPVWEIAQREGFPAENGIIMEEPPEKGPSRGLMTLNRLHFQFQRSDLTVVQAVDLQAHPDKKVRLSTSDNYRLLLEPADECYLYLFQLTSSDKLIQLFPDSVVSPDPNPLPAGQESYLPALPNWFYLDQTPGKEQIYVLASPEPLPELEERYVRYRPTAESAGQPDLLTELLQIFESYQEAPGDPVHVWTFSFTHQ